MGSPSVSAERFWSGQPMCKASEKLREWCGIERYAATTWYASILSDTRLTLIWLYPCSDEIGGANGMKSLIMSQ